jgi:hypothetical protein
MKFICIIICVSGLETEVNNVETCQAEPDPDVRPSSYPLVNTVKLTIIILHSRACESTLWTKWTSRRPKSASQLTQIGTCREQEASLNSRNGKLFNPGSYQFSAMSSSGTTVVSEHDKCKTIPILRSQFISLTWS